MNIPKEVRLRTVVILLSSLLVLSSVSIYYAFSASTPTSGLTDIYIEPPMMESSYIIGIYTAPDICYLKNGTTGVITTTGTYYNVLQTAITALTTGGKIFIRAGRYTQDMGVSIQQNGIYIEGEALGGVGEYAVQIDYGGGFNNMVTYYSTGTHYFFGGIKNIAFRGNGTAVVSGSKAIYIWGFWSDLEFINCYFSYFDIGAQLTSTLGGESKIWNIWFDNCLFESNWRYGIYFSSTSDIILRMIDRVRITNSHFYDNLNSIYCDTQFVYHVTFTDNTVQAERGACINVTSGGRQWIITDNHIFDCGIGANGTMAAIMVNGTGAWYPDSWLIENNIIANHFTSAPVAMNNSIWLTGTVTNFVIQGNFFYQAAEPIRLSGLTSFNTLKIQGNLDYARNLVFPTESNKAYAYIVDKLGSTYFMLNCSTNNIDYSSLTCTTVYTYALGNCSEKQKILAKVNTYYGSYYFASDSILTVCTAGETISVSNLTYFNGTTYRWYLADADAETTIGNGTVSVTMSTATAGNLFLRLTEGFIYYSGWAWTAASKIYVSTTAGALTETSPSGVGDQIMRVGYAFNSTTIEFKISDVYLEHV